MSYNKVPNHSLVFGKSLSEGIVTFTFYREKDNPSMDPGRFCTRMSLRLSEEHKWESVLCDELTASAGVCQYLLDAGNE